MTDKKNYAVVTASYWGFTVTDGALRMLVLLHFHTLGYAPFDLALLFLLYEAMGILTNFFGGWIGARFGLRTTLIAGLSVQIIALLMLAALPASLGVTLSVAYVMAAQALSGIAKDLTKMSSKSAVKLVVDDTNQGLLFSWVAMLTGSKNALKGLGFFLGGLLLETIGFSAALAVMALALFLILMTAMPFLKADIGKAKTKIKGKELFSKSGQINYLSAARIFLFASRDVWFVVALPVFLASAAGWNFNRIGSFMALWVIGYGVMQALVPRFLAKTRTSQHAAVAARLWGILLAVVTALLAFGLTDQADMLFSQVFEKFSGISWLLIGLVIFGFFFAVNSALHSYLIVAYSDRDKVSLNVGFYYMANAVGRLAGTFFSGLIYQYYGLVACLLVSSSMVLMAVFFTLPLARPDPKKVSVNDEY